MLLIPGFIPGSSPFDPERSRIILGLEKAINTAAAAFSPGVWVKISTTRPIKKEEISSNQPGVSKGSSNINITYRYGLIYPSILILFSTKTWISTRIIKRIIFLLIMLFIYIVHF
jgi:hypothetical protein